MAFIEVNDAKFYYEVHGEGQPVVLVTGYAGDHNWWTATLPYLAEHYQVVIFDNRGVGQTEDDGRPLSAELMADDVIAIADALELQKPHLVGSSMGGTIVQTAAINHADKIGKIVLLVTSAKWRQVVHFGLKVGTEMQVADVPVDIALDSMAAWVFGENFLADKEKVAVFRQAAMNNPYPVSVETRRRQFEVIKNFDSRDQLSSITAETLVAYGKEDILSLPYESQFLADNIPHAKMAGFQAAHGVPIEVPREFAQALIEFFN